MAVWVMTDKGCDLVNECNGDVLRQLGLGTMGVLSHRVRTAISHIMI